MNSIEVNNVSMCYNLYKEKVTSIKEYAVKLSTKGKVSYEELWVLKDISFTIESGETVAIIGKNGSGKSTLLKLIARVMKPTIGDIKTYGTIAPLIELGAGFDAELSARENIYLNGAVLGYSKAFMDKIFDEIIEFSELHDFIDSPLKNYSSGMYARLGFSIATAIKPNILIADEILGVGDFKFQQKCKERIKDILTNDTTLILVSHSASVVTEVCEKAIWIDDSRIKMIGDSKTVCAEYLKS